MSMSEPINSLYIFIYPYTVIINIFLKIPPTWLTPQMVLYLKHSLFHTFISFLTRRIVCPHISLYFVLCPLSQTSTMPQDQCPLCHASSHSALANLWPMRNSVTHKKLYSDSRAGLKLPFGFHSNIHTQKPANMYTLLSILNV